MKKNDLHAAAVLDTKGDYWSSLPPHEPGACFGASGAPCPETKGECSHRHRTSDSALECSRNRPVWGTIQERLEYLRGEIRAERISMGEILELQGLLPHIDADDGELLAWAEDQSADA